MIATLIALQTVIAPPKIGRIAGFVVGQTTIAQYERRHRKGFAHVGGHPNGARTWYDRTLGATLDVDGFDYSDKGEIVDNVNVEWGRRPRKGIPKIRLAKGDVGFLSNLEHGMTEKQVETALHLKLKNGEVMQKGLIRYKERPVNRDRDRYTEWKAHFDFDARGGLESVDVFAD